MIGNFVNNKRFIELREKNEITVEPFDKRALKTIHYGLHPDRVMEYSGEDSKGNLTNIVVHDFDVTHDAYKIPPSKYVLVRVVEYVRIPEGIVGHFVPSTDLIDRGLILTAGRVEAPFGDADGKKQKLQFGVLNAGTNDALLHKDTVVAWMYLVDLRGLGNLSISISQADLNRIARKVLEMSHAQDDGVRYDEER